jgi:4-hydroxy-tetrahydrodipicolinate synthase
MTRVIAAVIDQAGGRVPVFAGTGSNSTRRTIELSQQARDLGVDGLMLVCPYYNKPGPAGLEAHFRAVMEAVPLPTMLYNSPGRTGCDLGVSTLARMTDLDPLIGVKEASGNVLRSQAILAHLGDRFQVLAGDDPLTLAVLGVGGHGVVSVTANIAPRLVSRVTEAFAEGRLAEAQRLHHRLVPLHEALFIETNPGPVKAALWMLDGAAPEIRSPLTWPEESSLERIRAVMERVGVAR